MTHVFLATRKFLCDEGGVTAVEYGLIAALIAVAVMTIVYLLGQELNAFFLRLKNCLQTPSSC